MRDLLVHEWLAETGGSENVFEEIHQIFPDAGRLALWNDAPQRFGQDVAESWLARTPLRRSKAIALPFMPRTWHRVDITEYDRVIVSSHAFAHHLASKAAADGKLARAYVHTPARYIWSPELDTRGRHWTADLIRGRLQNADRRAVSPLVDYAANSEFVKQRIQRHWGVDATVIYPPVDVDRITRRGPWTRWLDGADADRMHSLPSDYVFGASRMIPYKEMDWAIRVGELLGRPVVLAGEGPDEPRLRAIADESSVPVHFLGRVSDDLLIALYQAAALFVFLPIEDFGIMPVEAMATGTPSLVNSVGGASESVSITGLGVAWSPNSDEELGDAAARALALKGSASKNVCERFSNARFRADFHAWASAS